MPHLRPLDALRDRLQAALDPRQIFHAPVWGDPKAMADALRQIKRDIGGSAEGQPHADVLKTSLNRFASAERVGNFTELKYVCFGVTVPVGEEQWRIIDRPPLFERLLQEVGKYERQPKQFRRCYQGLLSGYFGFERYAANADGALPTWHRLRGYLGEKLDPILKVSSERAISPDWLLTLQEHRNLLTENPCSRYAEGFGRGDPTDLRDVCAGLGIEGASWVWQDALMAYVHLVCQRKDAEFREGLEGVLKVVNGHSDLKLPSTLATQATATSVIRYGNCVDRPEHPELRDTCLQWIGNPWLKRTAWDAHVNHEPARQMVDGWLKRRLIRDFFELLAEDGAADLRRLNYWLKWAPQVSDMWFVLGADAWANRSPAFVELRKRMNGRDRVLTNSPPQNNAFVMRIGPLLVIEFGVTGNACYVFDVADFRTSLDDYHLSLHQLKQRVSAKRLSHTLYWESRFDLEMGQLLQMGSMSGDSLGVADLNATSQPQRKSLHDHLSALKPFSKTPNSAQLKGSAFNSAPAVTGGSGPRAFTNADLQFLQMKCAQHDIELEDNRPKSGALWVLLRDRNRHLALSNLLFRYGFQYAEGKGFWLKEGSK